MSSHTLFISDLHLDASAPHITAHFLHFIEQEAPKAEALYILGDFFDAWLGDDNIDTPFNQKINHALKNLKSKGTPVYFMRGNRDLLIGKSFAKASGVILLQDPTLIQLYQQPVLLTHGDCLCTDDIPYQVYRYCIRQQWIQKLLLSLIPLSARKKLIKKMRQNSQQRNRILPSWRMDVNAGAFHRYMKKHSASLMIHGHTHHPGIHKSNGASGYQRIVLGAWYAGGSVLKYFENGEYVLYTFNLNQEELSPQTTTLASELFSQNYSQNLDAY